MTPEAQFHSQRDRSGRDSRPLVALAEQGQQVWDELAALLGAAQRAGREGHAFLLEALDTSPYVTLGAAAAAGYLVGGGLPAWATRRAFDFATRITGMFVLQRLFDAARGGADNDGTSAGERF